MAQAILQQMPVPHPPSTTARLESPVTALAHPGVTASSIMKTMGLCSMYIAVSAGLIHLNKHLMHKDRFPFAIALSTGHMFMTCLCCNILYFVKPSFFPSMAKTEGQRLQMLRWFLPLGCLFAIGMSCSNKAYLYCTVPFLQFMKESNVAVVFALACLAGLQQCTRSRIFVIAWIMLGAGMAIHGEVHFVLVGFGLQALSQLGECGKTVLGEWIMTDGFKLDPLTYTMFMSPICFCILFAFTVLTWDHEIAVQFASWWPVLLPNAFVAFTLNVICAFVIKECSAITFMLTGLVKDMVIVLGCMVWFGDIVVRQQFMGFGICLGGIAFWSLMRSDPDCKPVKNLRISLGEPTKQDMNECSHLLARKSGTTAGP